MAGFITTADGKRYEIKDLSPDELRKIFTPYGAELGYLVAAWNRLHDTLAQLFSVIFTPQTERPTALNSRFYKMAVAVWHSTNSLPARRAVRNSLAEASPNHLRARLDHLGRNFKFIVGRASATVKDIGHTPKMG
jgi:hypothetical protein